MKIGYSVRKLCTLEWLFSHTAFSRNILARSVVKLDEYMHFVYIYVGMQSPTFVEYRGKDRMSIRTIDLDLLED